ncbi:MAG TPA: apolipoprotein N-acyltransferase [Steroidobacteraceae bacterium]|nr:apolipoprotein N-acyltransferase [Steroidobacteraceae bacterium]
MRAPNFYAGLGLVTFSGCLWFLACTPFDLSALAWVAAVPMLAAVDRAPTFRQALFLGWWAGVVETAGGFYWLIETMRRFADFPWIGAALVFFVFCAARGLIFLLFTAAVVGIRRRAKIPLALLAPPVMAVCELVVPQVFPCGQWISQAWQPLVIQIAEITGPLGVTALLMVVNGALYDLIDAPRAARWPLIGAASALAAALLFGAVRMREVDDALARTTWLKIGLVQPNIAYTADGEISAEEALRQLTALQEQSRRLVKLGADLVVWSEGSYPVTLPRDLTADFTEDYVGMIRRGITKPLVIGTSTYDAKRDKAYNSAILIETNGNFAGRYDKVRLLAFGEYIPGIEYFPWLAKLLPAGAGSYTPGAGPVLLELHGPGGVPWALGPVICYEDILPGYLRRVGALHPNLLVNLTSDSWFGAGSEPWEHLALAVFATVELRVAMVRAVNSGVSTLIDPNGRVVVKTYADDPYRHPRPADGVLVTAPRMQGGDTLYVRYGYWFPCLCLAGIAVMAGWAVKRRARGAP